jgi:hypothetical protein
MIGREKFQTGGAALLRGLDFWRHGSAALPLIATILFFALGAMSATTNTLSDVEIQGRRLAQQLLEQQRPAESFTNTGILKIKDGKGRRSEFPVKFQTITTASNWLAICEITGDQTNFARLTIIHDGNRPNQYDLQKSGRVGTSGEGLLTGNEAMIPFGGSDFWAVDLGLEFFHWPEQKLLKRVVRSSRGCSVLESTNPDPATNGYSRVVSWVDSESYGIIHAEAYDAKGRLLKEYDTKKLKKVNGQWQVEEIEICNDQTDSRTRLEFDLKKE